MTKFWNIKNLGDKGELKIYGQITSEEPWFDNNCTSYISFINEMESLNNCKNIDVYISSPGGDVFIANTIYSWLKQNKAYITVIIEAICASAATIIAMAGNTIKAEKNSLIMLHNPSVGLIGYYNKFELDKYRNMVEAIKKSIIEAYISKVNKSEDELSELMNNETWYTGKEAFENGIIDECFENSEYDTYLNYSNNKYAIINNFVCNIEHFKNFPIDKIKNINKIKNKKQEAIFMTSQKIKEEYPNIYNEICEKAIFEERKRLKAIDEIAINIPKEMVNRAKYVDCISAENLAINALKANKIIAENIFSSIVEDNIKSGVKEVISEDSFCSEDNKQEKRISRLVSFINKGELK